MDALMGQMADWMGRGIDVWKGGQMDAWINGWMEQ